VTPLGRGIFDHHNGVHGKVFHSFIWASQKCRSGFCFLLQAVSPLLWMISRLLQETTQAGKCVQVGRSAR